jgi:hypothetical protein
MSKKNISFEEEALSYFLKNVKIGEFKYSFKREDDTVVAFFGCVAPSNFSLPQLLIAMANKIEDEMRTAEQNNEEEVKTEE